MSDNEPYENWDGKCFDCGAPCEVDTGNGRLYDSGTDNQHHRYSCTIYRQARTIRRLRALADGYRERLRMTLDHCEMDEDIAAMDADDNRPHNQIGHLNSASLGIDFHV